MDILPDYYAPAAGFLAGKSEKAQELFLHFLEQFRKIGPVQLYPAKTMMGISANGKRIAWITQVGKSFIQVVFPFEKRYGDNLCFQKMAQVPGDDLQFNHHFRMQLPEDVNEEVKSFMQIAFDRSV